MEKVVLPRVRDLGQTVGDPFLFARQNLALLGRAFLYYSVPPLLVAVGLTALGITSSASRGLLYGSRFSESSLRGLGASLIVAYVIFMLASLFQQLYISEFIILKELREEVSNSDVLQQLKKDWKIILSTFLVMVPLGIAGIILILMVIKSSDYLGSYVAGFIAFLLYLFFFYSFFPLSHLLFIRLRERLGIIQSLGKSYRIVSGNWWKTFVAWLVVMIVVYALLTVLTLPFSIAIWTADFHRITSHHSSESNAFNTAILGISATIGAFAMFFFANIFHILIGISYFSLSEKYDSHHLRTEINRIGDRVEKNSYKQEGEF